MVELADFMLILCLNWRVGIGLYLILWNIWQIETSQANWFLHMAASYNWEHTYIYLLQSNDETVRHAHPSYICKDEKDEP